MRAREIFPGLWILILLAFVPGETLAQPPSSATLGTLIERVQKPESFGEIPQLLAMYLSAEVQATEEGVGEIERESPPASQQSGANANSSGTTTLVEKPGIADLVNLAIERGAILKTTSGTSFTLQTTPYMIYSRFGGADTEETWSKLAVLRRIGISATFNQSAGNETPQSDNFENGEVKYTIGDRSPRDKDFLEKRLRPKLLQSGAFNAVDATTADLLAFLNQLSLDVRKKFFQAGADFNNWRDKKQQAGPISRPAILDELSVLVADIVPALTAADMQNLNSLAQRLDQEGKALAAASKIVADEAKEYIDQHHPQFSLSYGYQRDMEISDFSSLKLLFGYQTEGTLSLNLNGEVMINNHGMSEAGEELDRVRAYSVEGGATMGKFAGDSLDFTAGFKWMRPMGEDQDLRSFQAKLNLYLLRGVTIPIALTYVNRTEELDKSRVRLNVGLSLSGDALMGVARKAAQ